MFFHRRCAGLRQNVNYKAFFSRVVLFIVFSLHATYCIYNGRVITRLTREVYFESNPILFLVLMGVEVLFIIYLLYSVTFKLPKHNKPLQQRDC